MTLALFAVPIALALIGATGLITLHVFDREGSHVAPPATSEGSRDTVLLPADVRAGCPARRRHPRRHARSA